MHEEEHYRYYQEQHDKEVRRRKEFKEGLTILLGILTVATLFCVTVYFTWTP